MSFVGMNIVSNLWSLMVYEYLLLIMGHEWSLVAYVFMFVFDFMVGHS